MKSVVPTTRYIRNVQQRVDSIDEAVKAWPSHSKKVAYYFVDKYDLPHEATPHLLIWYYNKPWKKTVIHRDLIPHNFPKPHWDILEQTVDYHVPAERSADLVAFDGSIIIDRTRGELAVHCATEEMNMALLNLAHEIVVRRKTVEEARREMARIVMAMRYGWPEPLTQRIQFPVFTGDQEYPVSDPDQQVKGI